MTFTAQDTLDQTIQNFEADVEQAKQFAQFIVDNKDKAIMLATIDLSRQLGCLMRRQPHKLEEALIERVTHLAWKAYFWSVKLHDRIGAEYYTAIHPYQLEDLDDQSYYGLHKAITPFTLENIKAFEQKYFVKDEAVFNEYINQFLMYCGAPRKTPTEYKGSLTMRNVARVVGSFSTDRAEAIGKLICALTHYQNKDVPPTMIGDIKTKLMHIRGTNIDTQLSPDVRIVVKDSLNAKITFSNGAVSLLNSRLAEAV